MDWEKEALQSVERVPFFVRRMVKKRIEELAAQKRHHTVTMEDVHEARQRFMGGPVPSVAQPAPAPPASPVQSSTVPTPVIPVLPQKDGIQTGATDEVFSLTSLTTEQLERLEAAVDRIEGFENRFFSIRVCGGAAGCPLTQVDVKRIGDRLAEQITASGLAENMRAKISGPIFTHHRFKVAVAGCPNSCSEPQIKDFALVAQTKPRLTDEPCTECGLCVDSCRDRAIALVDGGPAVDSQLCVGCGDCLEACPTGTLATGKEGLTVYVGGKLGRHAQLATEFMECVSEEDAYQAFQACLALSIEEGSGGERLGSLLNRLGLERLRGRLQDKPHR